MSAVHDTGTLVRDAPDRFLQTGDRIEVVGYAIHPRTVLLEVVYRDDEGALDTIPANAVRLEPRVERIQFNEAKGTST